MADIHEGVLTRSQRRQRSQSREPVPAAPANAGRQGRDRTNQMESVPENGYESSLPSTPVSSSQKSQRPELSYTNGLNTSQPSSLNSSPRPLSPASFERKREKEELQRLNDRLATVLLQHTQAKSENIVLKERLEKIVFETDQTLESHVQLYKEELDRAREALDNEANGRAQETILREKLESEVSVLMNQLATEKRRADENENRSKNAEKQLREKDRKLSDMMAALEENQAKIEALEDELQRVKAALEIKLTELEQETRSRVGLQNNLVTVIEKAKFDMKLLEDKLKQKTVIVSEDYTDGRRMSIPGSPLSGCSPNIQEDFRKTVEDRFYDLEDQLAETYNSQIEDLQRQNLHLEDSLKVLQSSTTEKMKEYREGSKYTTALQQRIRDLENEIMDLQQGFNNYKDQADERFRKVSDSARETSDRYQHLLEEYRKLQSLNSEIMNELKMYDELLAGEEKRLGIDTPTRVIVAGRGIKRSRPDHMSPSNLKRSAAYMSSASKPHSVRTTVTTSANKSKSSGDVRILEVQPGKLVRIENTGKEIFSLGNCILYQRSHTDLVEYLFDVQAEIAGSSVMSIYSVGSDVPHDGITEKVWDKSWLDARNLETFLVDVNGKELASYESASDLNGHAGAVNGGSHDRRSASWLSKLNPFSSS